MTSEQGTEVAATVVSMEPGNQQTLTFISRVGFCDPTDDLIGRMRGRPRAPQRVLLGRIHRSGHGHARSVRRAQLRPYWWACGVGFGRREGR
ncbi:hypothetical protein Ato02nite_013860 [Paractinoplanes toevensis]|uniref:Uncharacterized protein n=1 Tax=Paractinoplanes toevensis TaxID=571911 RepID=A0A919T643_9ACTN|nr:hypothetical protein Ato02nite_013860 [Actinoplanes toevensis]